MINLGEEVLWQQDIQESKKRSFLLIENKKCTYALSLGRCLAEFDSKIKQLDAYVQADADQDVVQLLAIIQGYCCQFDDNQQNTQLLEGLTHRVSTFYQSYDATTMEYVEHFKALVGVGKESTRLSPLIPVIQRECCSNRCVRRQFG
jgi:hypothetical protein